MRRSLTCGVIAAVLVALLVGFALGTWFGLHLSGAQAIAHMAGLSPSGSTSATAPRADAIHATFTDATLTQELRQSMHGDGDALSVHLEPDLVVVTGKVQRFLGQEVRIELIPFVEGGRVAVKVKGAHVGPVAVPLDVAQALSSQAARALSREQEKIPGLMVDTIVVKQGLIDVIGHIDKSKVPPPPPPPAH